MFDTKGKNVTIRQLLGHTSGIKNYSELPIQAKIIVQKLQRDTLLRIIEDMPFDFEPGEQLIYNNTGYFMLGHIIEKITGLTYEAYVAKNLFEKAGMTNSYYCSENRITKNRAHGYQMSDVGLIRAEHPNHTWPYGAGSAMFHSTRFSQMELCFTQWKNVGRFCIQAIRCTYQIK